MFDCELYHGVTVEYSKVIIEDINEKQQQERIQQEKQERIRQQQEYNEYMQRRQQQQELQEHTQQQHQLLKQQQLLQQEKQNDKARKVKEDFDQKTFSEAVRQQDRKPTQSGYTFFNKPQLVL